MKKIITVFIAIIMVLCISVSATAAAAGFVSSPSSKPAPEISGSKSDDCTGSLVIVPFSDRNSLSDDEKKQIEDAYNSITNNANALGKLAPDLEDFLKKNGIDGGALGVSDLFKLDNTGCNEHNSNHIFDVTLTPDTLKDFVALLRFDGNGWSIVTDAKVNGNHLSFSSPGMHTYAILTGKKAATSPKTSDNSSTVYYAIMMLASGVLASVLWKKSIKKVA